MNKVYNVIYSPQAVEDLKDIYSYIAFELLVPTTAENLVNKLRKNIRALDFMPERFPIVDWAPWDELKMRKLPVDNFIVFYLVDSESLSVNIVRILYSGRDIESIAQSDNI